MGDQHNFFEPFSFMTKPAGSACNLNCSYCYYLEKDSLFNSSHRIPVMEEEVLEKFISGYIYTARTKNVLFTWHGGEPLLSGLDFYKKVIRYQKKYGAGRIIENSLQTNGVLLNDEWCSFFADNRFLIGISLDGPEHCHDRYRKNKDGKGSFHATMKGIGLLRKHKVEFNILAVVNDYNSQFPLEVYSFLKTTGSIFYQFTPVVERISNGKLVNPAAGDTAQIAPYSVTPEAYGDFLIAIFREWVKKDVGDYYVVTFDCILANYAGVAPPLCIYAKTCGRAGVIEADGSIFPCDHFVFEDKKMGNIRSRSLLSVMSSDEMQDFGNDKFNTLPDQCLSCEFINICFGECPRNRFAITADGQPGLNYLCTGMKKFYRISKPFFLYMYNEIRNNRAASNVRNININL